MTDSPLMKSKTIVRFWSALMSDFEDCLMSFLHQPSNNFAPFAEVVKKMKLPLIMNTAIAPNGCNQEAHYDLVVDLILETARGFWLRPRLEPNEMSAEDRIEKGEDGTETSLDDNTIRRLDYRSRLAGFYLTYTMFIKQPEYGRNKILISHQFYDYFEEFEADTNDPKIALLDLDKVFIKTMLQFLKKQDAFAASLTGFANMGIEPWRRALRLAQENHMAKVAMEERFTQDCVSQVVAAAGEGGKNLLEEYVEAKKEVAEKLMMGVVSDLQMEALMRGDKELQDHLCITEVISGAMSTLAAAASRPALTMELLTGDEVAERRIMMDIRAETKKVRKQLEGRPDEPKKHYMGAHTVWSKPTKETEGVDKQTRQRGELSRNVWVYLKGLPFDHNDENDWEDLPSSSNAPGPSKSEEILVKVEPQDVHMNSDEEEDDDDD